MARIDLRSYRKARSPFGSLMRLFRYFKHCRLLLICAVASILAYAAATIAASYCMKPLVNLLKTTGLAPDAVYAKYLALLLGLAGLYVLSVVTNYLLNRLMLECSTVIMRALRTELFDKMQRLPIRYFDENTNGSLMSYFTNDIEATNELLQHSITQMMISVMSLLGTVGMMLALIVHWNVDIGSGTETGQTSEPTSQTQIDRENAPSFTDDDLKETEQPSESGELEKLGEVYYDAATGKYYIIENSGTSE